MGNVTCYQHDALHRLTVETVVSGSYSSVTPAKTYVYDSTTLSGNGAPLYNTAGHLSEAYTGSVMSKITDVGFSYSPRGEVMFSYEATPHSAGYYMVSATYWPNGLLDFISTNQPSFPTYTYSPDGEGRPYIISASTGQYPVTATIYNVNGQPTSVALGSMDLDTFGYDPNTGRQTSYAFRIGTQTETATLTNNANGTVQQIAISDPFYSGDSQTCTYLYGDIARLASFNCGSVWANTYGYDFFGNITKSMVAGSPGTAFAPTYNMATNRFQTIPGTTPVYDTNGNLEADGFHTYAWDANGKPITIDTTSLTYDALGRRVEFGSGSTYTQYFYPPYNPGFPSGQASAQTNAVLRLDLPGQGQARATSSGVGEYRHPNYQGSQVVGSSPTQTILADGAFTPYGEHYAVSPTDDGYFAGMLSISPTMVDGYAATNRAYQYGQGRWISPDPAGLAAVDLTNPNTFNRYAYASADPANNTDPSGLVAPNYNPVPGCPPGTYYNGSGCSYNDPTTTNQYGPINPRSVGSSGSSLAVSQFTFQNSVRLAPPSRGLCTAAAVAAGAAGGALLGATLGGGAGAALGGAGGTLVAPGLGTVAIGVLGAEGGASLGAPIGEAIGGALGGLVGSVLCSKISGPTFGGNQRENKQANDAKTDAERITGKKFTRAQERAFHDEIAGQGYGYHELVQIAVEVLEGVI